MYAIYGEQFGRQFVEEDGFSSKEEALEWLKANKTGVNALGNWEIREGDTEKKCICDYAISGVITVAQREAAVGHLNQAGGYCCPHHGNTCGYCHHH